MLLTCGQNVVKSDSCQKVVKTLSKHCQNVKVAKMLSKRYQNVTVVITLSNVVITLLKRCQNVVKPLSHYVAAAR